MLTDTRGMHFDEHTHNAWEQDHALHEPVGEFTKHVGTSSFWEGLEGCWMLWQEQWSEKLFMWHLLYLMICIQVVRPSALLHNSENSALNGNGA